MSINLTCDEFPLWQTPTKVTVHIIESVADFDKEWIKIYTLYVLWVMGIDGMEYEDKIFHIENLCEAAKNGPLTFSYI